MQMSELTLSKMRKINLGNYETMDVFIALKVSLESGDTPKVKEIYGQLSVLVDTLLATDVEKTITEHLKAKKLLKKTPSEFDTQEVKK